MGRRIDHQGFQQSGDERGEEAFAWFMNHELGETGGAEVTEVDAPWEGIGERPMRRSLDHGAGMIASCHVGWVLTQNGV